MKKGYQWFVTTSPSEYNQYLSICWKKQHGQMLSTSTFSRQVLQRFGTRQGVLGNSEGFVLLHIWQTDFNCMSLIVYSRTCPKYFFSPLNLHFHKFTQFSSLGAPPKCWCTLQNENKSHHCTVNNQSYWKQTPNKCIKMVSKQIISQLQFYDSQT